MAWALAGETSAIAARIGKSLRTRSSFAVFGAGPESTDLELASPLDLVASDPFRTGCTSAAIRLSSSQERYAEPA
ncbi:MAG TPA: hypothetical protein DEA08_30635 [Planctomycetes bacterium]|nr:hypothetical protein [Planctomycetota bacterium]